MKSGIFFVTSRHKKATFNLDVAFLFYNFTCYQCGPFCGINKATKGAELMPEIIPIRDLKNTNAISQRCHETQEPIFVTKSGYGDMVIMSIRAPRMLSGEFLFMATPHNSRLTMRVPQPDIIEHFGNADAVPQPPERCLSRTSGAKAPRTLRPLPLLRFAVSATGGAFGLASAAPRSPYRHLELCGIALKQNGCLPPHSEKHP
jgi:hypothetical protein